jgi:membrane protein
MGSLILLPVRVVRRFFAERLAQTSAALAFSTLLGLVPLIAVATVIVTRFPFASGLTDALNKFMLTSLLPDKSGATVAKYVAQFARKAESMQWIGASLLAATAMIQMLTIEHTFNAIWRVREHRPLLRRLIMHLTALALGPVLFGGSIAVITYVASVSLGFFDEPQWIDAVFFHALPFVFTAALFAVLYWAVPAKTVNRVHALAGGVFAAAGFTLMQRLFSLYIANFPAYTVIYGAFAVVPIFLLWLYLSWGVVLVGALIVAELPGPTSARRSRAITHGGKGSRSNS